MSVRFGLLGGLALICIAASSAHAIPINKLSDTTIATREWLIIGTGAANDSTTPEGQFNKGIGDAVDISNFEIGAIKAPVPANQPLPPCPDADGCSFGPSLKFESSVPNVPGVNIDAGPDGIVGVLPEGNVIGYDGNIAITHLDDSAVPNPGANGSFNVSNIGIFAKNVTDGGAIADGTPAGIVCAAPANTDTSNGGCIAGKSNSYFNDEDYPNPISDPADVTNTVHEANLIDAGLTHQADFGLESGNGITGGHDFSDVRTSLDIALLGASAVGAEGAFPGIPNLSQIAPISCLLEDDNGGVFEDVCNGTATVDLTDHGDHNHGGAIVGDDLIDPTTLYIKLNDGLNVIDFNTGGADLSLTNANIIIDGSERAAAIFRIPTGLQFTINQGNILIGDMGIMTMNVLFFSDTVANPTAFDFNNAIFNGIAFWALGDGSGIDIDNSQGCVQLVGDVIDLDNVRYTRCAYKGVPEFDVPEPGTLALFGIGLLGLGYMRRRRKAV